MKFRGKLGCFAFIVYVMVHLTNGKEYLPSVSWLHKTQPPQVVARYSDINNSCFVWVLDDGSLDLEADTMLDGQPVHELTRFRSSLTSNSMATIIRAGKDHLITEPFQSERLKKRPEFFPQKCRSYAITLPSDVQEKFNGEFRIGK